MTDGPFDLTAGTNQFGQGSGPADMLAGLANFNQGQDPNALGLNFGNTLPGQQGGNAFTNFFNSPNFEAFNTGLGTLTDIGKLWGGITGIKNSKKSLRFQQDSFNKNFNASAQAYNNELKDRWYGRSNAARQRGQTFASEADFLSGRQIQKV